MIGECRVRSLLKYAKERKKKKKKTNVFDIIQYVEVGT